MWSSSKFLSNFLFFFRFWFILYITCVLWCRPHVIWLEIQSLALMWGYSQKSCALLYLCSYLNLWVFVYISEFKLWCIFLNRKLLEFRVFHITSKLSKAILLQLHYNSYYTHTHTFLLDIWPFALNWSVFPLRQNTTSLQYFSGQ